MDICWGVCPYCLKSDGGFDFEHERWFFCRRHKTKWGWTTNSSVSTEINDERRRAYEFLLAFEEVKPAYLDNDYW